MKNHALRIVWFLVQELNVSSVVVSVQDVYIATDCGGCINCRDMKQFGGPGRKKRCCVQQKCVKLARNHNSFAIVSSSFWLTDHPFRLIASSEAPCYPPSPILTEPQLTQSDILRLLNCHYNSIVSLHTGALHVSPPQFYHKKTYWITVICLFFSLHMTHWLRFLYFICISPLNQRGVKVQIISGMTSWAWSAVNPASWFGAVGPSIKQAS